MTQAFLWANRRFGELVSGADWGAADSVFTFNGAGLEILQRAKQRGLFAVSEQTIAPSAIEQALLREEQALHPGWERPLKNDFAEEFSRREQQEWRLADLILCGSEFVRHGIRQCGGPVEKCAVIPYGVDGPEAGQESKLQNPKSQRQGKRGPLRVLTVGTVGLRKGAPYVLAAAKALQGCAEFRWVGAINLLPEFAASMARHVQLVGAVPRSEVSAHYRWADVFLLASICEGSATASYEALAHGLPVVCTPNTGSIVREGTDGFIVPVRDPGVVADRLSALAANVHLICHMGISARQRAEQFSLESYGKKLLKTLFTHRNRARRCSDL